MVSFFQKIDAKFCANILTNQYYLTEQFLYSSPEETIPSRNLYWVLNSAFSHFISSVQADVYLQGLHSFLYIFVVADSMFSVLISCFVRRTLSRCSKCHVSHLVFFTFWLPPLVQSLDFLGFYWKICWNGCWRNLKIFYEICFLWNWFFSSYT